jgi:hypothetical protein
MVFCGHSCSGLITDLRLCTSSATFLRRECFVRLPATARYHRSDHQAVAINACRRTRKPLAGAAGIESGAELPALFGPVLRRDPIAGRDPIIG